MNVSNLEYLLLIFVSILCGVGIRFSLGLAKQRWAMTYHHTMSYALLPPVTMVITTLISGNIALSLGMIGALSIVRFRNPVKNPFELVIFFALITIGIGIAVEAKFGVLMTIVVMLVIFTAKKFDDYSQKKGKQLFSLSFEEGSNVHVIEIKSLKSISKLDDNKNLVQFFSSKNPESFNYRLIFQKKDEMNNLKKDLENNKDVENIEIRYAP
tara:strand:- start:734 stop:1369 length:636 start_codon:yes stop_codon:yes gene_type:complete